jgi:hypothetical protein
MTHERTFRTDGGRDRHAPLAEMETISVSGLICRIKKLTSTDDGKLTMAIEATATDDEALERVRDLILIQQGEVMLSLAGLAEAPVAGESVQ